MAEPETYTLAEAHAAIQATATQEGRCTQCGRRADDDEAKMFDELRDELAQARTERDTLRSSASAVEQERDALAAQLVEAHRALAQVEG